MIGYQIFRSYQFEKEISDTRKLMNEEYDKMKNIRNSSEKLIEDTKVKIGTLQEFVASLATDVLQQKSTDFISNIEEKTNQVIANIQTNDDNLKRNIELMNKLEKLDLELTPSVYNERGDIYYKQGNFEKATDSYTNSIRLDSNDIETYFKRGLAFHKSKKYKEAIEDYAKVIKFNNKHSSAYANTGLCYRMLSDDENAIKNLNLSISIDKNSHISYINRALIYIKENKIDLALLDLKNAEKINNKSVDLFIAYGTLYGNIKNYKMSIDYYLKAFDLSDKKNSDIGTKCNLAEIYILDGNYENAITLTDEIFSNENCNERYKIISKILKLTAIIFSGKDQNNEFNILIKTLTESINVSTDGWSFNEMIDHLSKIPGNENNIELVKKIISFIRGEIIKEELETYLVGRF